MRFEPKSVPEDHWKRLEPNRVYAVRSMSDDVVYLRLGMGKSFYLAIIPTQFDARLLNQIEFDTGAESILAKLGQFSPMMIGRAPEAGVKIFHAYISRLHTRLVLDGGILMISDMGSINGTFCHVSNRMFDIEHYLENHPLDQNADQTLDETHIAFGPELDAFLRRYQQQKENKAS